jgi:hypothetical protein
MTDTTPDLSNPAGLGDQLDASHMAGHLLSSGATLIAILGIFGAALGVVSGMAGLIWFCLQIWENRTFQHWIMNRRMVSRARKVARLKAREKILVAKIEALQMQRQARADARALLENAATDAKAKLADAASEAEKLKVSSEAKLQSELPRV